jgi:hypothetical protein
MIYRYAHLMHHDQNWYGMNFTFDVIGIEQEILYQTTGPDSLSIQEHNTSCVLSACLFNESHVQKRSSVICAWCKRLLNKIT